VTRIYIGLGSNIEPERRLAAAAGLLRTGFPDIRFSSCYQNCAVGFEGADFINAAASFNADCSLEQLISRLHRVEEQCGRQRDDAKWAPRAMDLDVLMYGDLISDSPLARLPRPDLLRRAYMLGPMAELAPALVHPLVRRAISELWQELAPQTPPLTRLTMDLNAL
jgi:2-amino-4-hydroxy-6-hydroxymethyldihydropteridine diphosphokinase